MAVVDASAALALICPEVFVRIRSSPLVPLTVVAPAPPTTKPTLADANATASSFDVNDENSTKNDDDAHIC